MNQSVLDTRGNVVGASLKPRSFPVMFSAAIDVLNQLLPAETAAIDSDAQLSEFAMPCSYGPVADMIQRLPGTVLKSIFGNSQRLVVGPCPDFVETVLPKLLEIYDEVVLLDKGKAGEVWQGIEIKDSDGFVATENCDYFVATITHNIAGIYSALFSQESSCGIVRLLFEGSQYLAAEPDSHLREIADCLSENPDAVVMLSTGFMTTLIPTVVALQERGHTLIWLGEHSVDAGYSAVATERVPADYSFTMSFSELLSVLSITRWQRQIMLVNTESYFHPQWDIQRSVTTYALGATLINFVHQFEYEASQWVQLLYDPIKGGNVGYDYAAASAAAYQSMLSTSDGIIYNSSVELMGEFIERALDLDKPRLHFYRYAKGPSVLRQRSEKERHVAVISTVLNEFHEPSKACLPEFVRNLLSQGIHLHYYTAYQDFADQFYKSLDTRQQDHFHISPVIFDPQKLVNEIQHFHAGLIMSYQHVFADIVAGLDHLFMKDAMQMFPATTVSTSSLVCAVAGLPLIANRAVRSYPQLYTDAVHSMEFSEVSSLGGFMFSDYWDGLMEAADQNQARFDIDNNIARLDTFLNALSERAAIC